MSTNSKRAAFSVAMKENTKNKLRVLSIMIIFTSLFIWSFYHHKNEPHWFETKYVKIIK
jgi:hypothetical protein